MRALRVFCFFIFPLFIFLCLLLQRRWIMTCDNSWENMRMIGYGFPFLSNVYCHAYCGSSGGEATNGLLLVLNCAFYMAIAVLLWALLRKRFEKAWLRFNGIFIGAFTIVLVLAAARLFWLISNPDNHWQWNLEPLFPECRVIHTNWVIFGFNI